VETASQNISVSALVLFFCYHCLYMKRNGLKNAIQNFLIAFAILLIWRGLWYIFDYFDRVFFDGNHAFSAIGGIIVGLLILYLPDKDLKELGKL